MVSCDIMLLSPTAAANGFKLFYASRIPLQCTLILTQLSQGLLWIHLYGRKPWVLSCLVLISTLGLLSIVMVAYAPFAEVSTCAHWLAHNTNICAQIQTYRGAVVTTAMISNEISIMLVPLCFTGFAVMTRSGKTLFIAWILPRPMYLPPSQPNSIVSRLTREDLL